MTRRKRAFGKINGNKTDSVREFGKNPSFLDTLSFTTTETGTFSGTVRMTSGDMQVDWGDGTKETIADGSSNLTHDYGGASGDKKIVITFLSRYKDVTKFDINNSNAKGDISDWEIRKLKNLNYFRINTNSFTGDLSSWDISGLTSLSFFYIYNNSFTGDLSSWDISGLTNLGRFYIDANFFTKAPVLTSSADFSDGISIEIQDNPDIGSTNVSNVLIGLDDYDGSNGRLDATGLGVTYSDLTTEGQTAHDNLVNNKGWTVSLDT